MCSVSDYKKISRLGGYNALYWLIDNSKSFGQLASVNVGNMSGILRKSLFY